MDLLSYIYYICLFGAVFDYQNPKKGENIDTKKIRQSQRILH